MSVTTEVEPFLVHTTKTSDQIFAYRTNGNENTPSCCRFCHPLEKYESKLDQFLSIFEVEITNIWMKPTFCRFKNKQTKNTMFCILNQNKIIKIPQKKGTCGPDPFCVGTCDGTCGSCAGGTLGAGSGGGGLCGPPIWCAKPWCWWLPIGIGVGGMGFGGIWWFATWWPCERWVVPWVVPWVVWVWWFPWSSWWRPCEVTPPVVMTSFPK